MGKAARLKLERHLVAPVRKQEPRIQPKLVWLATGVLATVTAVVVIVLVATRSQPTVPAAAAATAADRNAPASLVQAANNVGFHPTTEPGVGLIEGQPASAAGAPPYPALLDPSAQPGTFNSPGAAGKVTSAYRVQAFPTLYVINPAGWIIWRGDGEQPEALLHAWLLEAENE